MIVPSKKWKLSKILLLCAPTLLTSSCADKKFPFFVSEESQRVFAEEFYERKSRDIFNGNDYTVSYTSRTPVAYRDFIEKYISYMGQDSKRRIDKADLIFDVQDSKTTKKGGGFELKIVVSIFFGKKLSAGWRLLETRQTVGSCGDPRSLLPVDCEPLKRVAIKNLILRM